MRNRYVAHMQIERSATLPGDPDSVREALLSPELLSAWLGPWTDEGDGRSLVVTDDGVTRRVSGHSLDPDGNVRWHWAPLDAPDQTSEVVVHLDDHQGGTRILIRETQLHHTAEHQGPGEDHVRARASVGGTGFESSSDRWTRCLLALGAVLEQRLLVTV